MTTNYAGKRTIMVYSEIDMNGSLKRNYKQMTFKVPKVPTIFLSYKACYIKKSVQVTFSCFFKVI
jgi:hypothetical protein